MTFRRLFLIHSISVHEKFDLLCQMQRIRLVEEEIASRYHEGKMIRPGFPGDGMHRVLCRQISLITPLSIA